MGSCSHPMNLRDQIAANHVRVSYDFIREREAPKMRQGRTLADILQNNVTLSLRVPQIKQREAVLARCEVADSKHRTNLRIST